MRAGSASDFAAGNTFGEKFLDFANGCFCYFGASVITALRFLASNNREVGIYQKVRPILSLQNSVDAALRYIKPFRNVAWRFSGYSQIENISYLVIGEFRGKVSFSFFVMIQYLNGMPRVLMRRHPFKIPKVVMSPISVFVVHLNSFLRW